MLNILTILLICLGVWLVVWIISAIGNIVSILSGAPSVPAKADAVKLILELANVRPGEQVIDLGSGDGRLVFAAARVGANTTGYEVSWPVWAVSKLWQALGRHKGKLIRANIFDISLEGTDVVFCYLMPRTMARLKAKLEQELAPGTRVVSHRFPVPGWPIARKLGKVFLQYRL